MRAALAIALAAFLGGCVGDPAAPTCGDDGAGVDIATPLVHGSYMQTAPGSPWQTLLRSGGPAPLEVAVAAGPWSSWTQPVPSEDANATLRVVTVEPGTRGAGELRLEFASQGCAADRGKVVWDLAGPKAGVTPQPGQGVHVMTAGFLANGTLFYTNIPEIDTDPRWPRPDWYAWEGDAPLPVYVYDRDRAEQPAHWKAPSSLVLGTVPRSGDPDVDGAVASAADEADTQTGLGYFTTIPGFNRGLKEAVTTSLHVVVMAPEDGYTRPGNEAHPLYGESLVFLIKVLDVVDVPCPAKIDAGGCDDEVPATASLVLHG